MDTLALFERLAVALAIGLLIGIERGWKARDEAEGERTAGLRTHALSGLLGGVWGALAQTHGEGGMVALSIAFAVFAAAMTLFFWRETNQEGTRDSTNLIAALLAFSLGAFAVAGDMTLSAAAAVAATALLALKSVLHAWVRRLTWEELRSALILLAMTVILLPALPNRGIDPWGIINPHEIWLMTVLIAIISFTGYVAVKLFGDHNGIAVTGLAGGLVSSTAVTLSMAQLARAHPARTLTLAGGALISSATMLARVLAVVAIVNASLLAKLGLPLALACAVLATAGFALVGLRRAGANGEESKLELTNPLDVAGVLKFGALLTVIIVASQVAAGWAGDAGVYTVAALSGIADVDAVTLTMSRAAPVKVETGVAAAAILIVTGVNTVAKAVLGWISGGAQFGRIMVAAAAAALGTGTLAFAFL